MRRVSLVLAVIMILALTAVPVMAVEQPYVETRIKSIIYVDGLKFRDLNSNRQLDPYEDWRLPIEERIDDLLSQMTLEEKCGLLFHYNTGSIEQDIERITVQYVNHFLPNDNGTPDVLARRHNFYQELAESTRLGVPLTLSSDRAYNAWGGMIDLPHAAFGAADLELAAKLFDIYAKEMAATGYHITLHPSGVELFRTSWGEDHNWVAALTETYVSTFVANNVQTCLKHFPTNGYGAARSPADLLENYMIPWRAGFASGADWVMLTDRQGLSGATARAHFDEPTMAYLREELGFDGVVVTDWMHNTSGITTDGIAPADLTPEERLAYYMRIGIDQMGGRRFAPAQLIELVNNGVVTEERIDQSARRVLRTKFELGLFENPYVDPDAALRIAASQAYIAEQFEITDVDVLAEARNPKAAELDRVLQAASTILLINDKVLPLDDGTAVYVLGFEESEVAKLSTALAAYAEVVDDLALADFAVVRIANLGDSEVELISIALNAGVPVIAAIDSTAIRDYSWLVEQDGVVAVLLMTYNARIDHGSAIQGFDRLVNPKVLAEMLFGKRQPTGKLFNELPRSEAQVREQWGDVPFDLGATYADRIRIAAAINAGEPVPINLGDPLFMYGYGMRYDLHPKFEYSMLAVPSQVKAGEPFTVNLMMENKGWDGYTTIEVISGEEVIGTKFAALNGGLNRVVSIDAILAEPGTQTISVAGLSAAVEVVE